MQHHLAQLNIAHMRSPLDDPLMTRFVEQLEPINALAESSPGFVWRLQTVEGNATTIRGFDDDRILVNMSVWESLETLRAFVYKSAHVSVLRERASWFEPMEGASTVLWWVPEGHEPDVAEARERLEHLRADGPTPRAFTFAQPFARKDLLQSG